MDSARPERGVARERGVSRRGRRATAGVIVVSLAVTAMSLAAGFVLKDRCATHVWADGYQYRTSCYNDVFALYFYRGLDKRVFPYIHGDGKLDQTDTNGDLEYPVLTGYFVGGISHLARNGLEFFRENAAGLAVFAFAAVGLLAVMARDRRRIVYFAAAPALILYAFHNWDLIAVAFMCAGLFAFSRRADRTAGAMLGLGAAAKLFPGFVLPVLAIHRWRETRRAPVGMMVAGVGSFVLANVPVLAINPVGWLLPWKFQSTRFPNFETSWFFAYRHLSRLWGGGFWWSSYPRVTSVASGALFLIAVLLLLRAEARRARNISAGGAEPPIARGPAGAYATAFGVLLLFLLTAKVYSPQYALWLLPFFVLLEIPWYGFAAFAITDAAVWFAISAYFLAVPPLAHGDADFRLTVTEIAVVARYAVLAWLLWFSRRAREAVRSPSE